MNDCPLCQEAGVVRTYSNFGMQVSPCPDCNEAHKRQRQHDFAKIRRQAQALLTAAAKRPTVNQSSNMNHPKPALKGVLTIQLTTLLKHYNFKKQQQQRQSARYRQELITRLSALEHTHHCRISHILDDDPELLALQVFANTPPTVRYHHRRLKDLPPDERAALTANVLALREQGFSRQEIAAILEVDRRNLEHTFIALDMRRWCGNKLTNTQQPRKDV